MKSGFHSFPLFTALMILFLLGRLAFIVIWSLAQGHQQSSLALFQMSTSMRGARAKPKAGFWFNVQKQFVLESSGASLAKKPHLNIGIESHQGWEGVSWGCICELH